MLTPPQAERSSYRFRSTAHGISAASGKAGAIVGAFGFLYASQPKQAAVAAPYPPGIGLQNALVILTVANGLGLLCTIFFVPESKGRSLEDYETQVGAQQASHRPSCANSPLCPFIDRSALCTLSLFTLVFYLSLLFVLPLRFLFPCRLHACWPGV
jgi:hypothetical protein